MAFNLFKRSKKKSKKKEHYLGLVLREKQGVGLLLEVNHEQKTVKVVDQKKFTFSNSWEYLVEDVDEVLFELEKHNNTKVKKAILFLYSHIINQKTNKIKTPYNKKIKSLTTSLELKALGFIQFHEAVSRFLSRREESPLTSIVIELDKPSVTFLVYRGGEVNFSDTVAKTEDLVTDLESIFKKVKEDIILPSRIIIYDSDDLEEESTKIITHKWSENLFIQLPKVEVIKENELEEALISVFSKQLFSHESHRAIETEDDEVLGFHIGRDVAQDFPRPESPVEKKREFKVEKPVVREDVDDAEVRAQPVHEEEETFAEKEHESQTIRQKLGVMVSLFSKLNVPRLWPMDSGSNKLRFAPLFVIGLLLIVSSILSFLYFFHTATLVLYFKGVKQEKELKLSGTTGDASGKNTLKLKKIKKTVDKKDTIKTSGTKVIGQKAKGEVTVYNRELDEKTFDKDTVLSTKRGIKFVFQSNVKVASASETLTDEGNLLTVTGKTQASVAAEEIGPDGNVAKETKLTIGDFPEGSYFAIVKNTFSGGSKEDVQTVSKDDIAELEKRVVSKVKKEQDTLVSQDVGGREVLKDLTSIDVSKANYSSELGEEAAELSVTAKVNLIMYTYDGEDLKETISKIFSKSVPKNYELSTKSISYKLVEAEEEEGDVALTFKIKGRALPKIDKDKVVKSILGKSREQAEQVAREKYKAKGYKMEVDSALPVLRSRLPFFKKNITLRVEPL